MLGNTPQNSTKTRQWHRLSQLKKRLNVSGSSIWSWIKQGKFPPPVKLSENVSAWTDEAIEVWEQSRIAASQK